MRDIDPAGRRLIEYVIDLAEVEGSIALFPHERYDADAIGAAVSLAMAFRKLGCRTAVLADEATPESLACLPGLEEVIVYDDSTSCDAYDFAIAVDCHDPERMGRRAACYERIAHHATIDHHVFEGERGRLDYIDSSAASSCQLVFEIIWQLEYYATQPFFDPTIAELLLAGTITDTGRYTYSNTTPLCLRQAAFLLERFPIDLTALHYELYERTTIGRLQIQGDIFASIESHDDGNILFAHVTRKQLEARGVRDDDLSNFASVIRNAEGVGVAFLFVEQSKGVRVNIRSNDCFDAAAFAKRFGGGGHRRAAGMTIDDLSLDEAMAKVAREAKRTLDACREASEDR
ncbi:MAG: DHH family phosphoesterase [Saccharofermentanales bacterium]|jgi:phosphoesterase RecJ-like protein